MSEDELQSEVLSRVAIDRRAFVKKILLGTAFAVPIVASFDMSSLTTDSANAATPNGTVGCLTQRGVPWFERLRCYFDSIRRR